MRGQRGGVAWRRPAMRTKTCSAYFVPLVSFLSSCLPEVFACKSHNLSAAWNQPATWSTQSTLIVCFYDIVACSPLHFPTPGVSSACLRRCKL